MLNKANLTGKSVLFRLVGIAAVYAGTVRHVESDGLWIESPDFATEIAQDAAWRKPYSHVAAGQSRRLALFVPTGSLTFLMVGAE
jgi:hypothetical protein